MNDKNMKFTLYACLIVLTVSLLMDVLFLQLAQNNFEDTLFEMRGQINGLKGIVGVK